MRQRSGASQDISLARHAIIASCAIVLLALVVPTLVGAGQTSDAGDASATSGDAGAAEMARKLQNPLANIKAVMTDNTIGFDTGDDHGTSYGFQVQPVYAIDVPRWGLTFIPRAVIPILGLEPGTDVPRLLLNPTPARGGSVWGLGDIVVQGFVAPHLKSRWKWGVGPQFSFATASDRRLRGPHWGAGIAGVVTGDITPNLSAAVILGNLWSYNGSFSTATLQPALYYNLSVLPGAYVGYNAVVSADWKSASDNAWTVPLGLTFGRTFDLGGGHGFDVGAGPYYNAVRPDGAAHWQIRFGLTWVFP